MVTPFSLRSMPSKPPPPPPPLPASKSAPPSREPGRAYGPVRLGRRRRRSFAAAVWGRRKWRRRRRRRRRQLGIEAVVPDDRLHATLSLSLYLPSSTAALAEEKEIWESRLKEAEGEGPDGGPDTNEGGGGIEGEGRVAFRLLRCCRLRRREAKGGRSDSFGGSTHTTLTHLQLGKK